MADTSHWITTGARVQSLIPSVHRWAVSPDDAWIAWVERQRERDVHVTELSSWRRVTTLSGAPVAALHWSSPSTLVALRSAQRHATLHAYAVPDGGELAQTPLVDVGLRVGEISASADGRAMLIGDLARHGWLGPREAVREVYLARGELCDDVARIDPFDVADPRSALHGWHGRCALSPDGHAIAVAFCPSKSAPRSPASSLDASITFISLATREVRSHTLVETGIPVQLLWVSPTSVMAAFLDDSQSTGIHHVDEGGARSLVVRLSRTDSLRYEAPIALHPDRARALLSIRRSRDRSGANSRCLAMVVGLGAEAPQTELLGLSRDRPPALRDHSGGACWDGAGRLLTVTQPRAGEAHVARRDNALTPPHAITQFALPGDAPSDLTLTLAPRASHALATWRVEVNNGSDSARRLAVIALE